jgi:hypothetical protein
MRPEYGKVSRIGLGKAPLTAMPVQVLFIVASLALYIFLRYLFGPFVAVGFDMILFIGILLYVTRANAKVNKIFSSTNMGYSRIKDNSHRLNKEEINVKYGCLLCGQEVKGLNCNKCGSLLKKALF